MKRWGRILSASLLIALVAIGCEEDRDDDLNLRDDYLGTWDTRETAGENAPQFYTVQISAGSGDEQIMIRGLYNTPDAEVSATVDGFRVTIPPQTTAGIEFSGSGEANTDINQINLSFTANDGSGLDEIEAELTAN